MIITPVTLINSKFAASSQTTVYTTPASTTTIIDKFTATNSSASSAAITINLVPSGGTAGTSNQIISSLSIAANTCVDLTELQNQILSTGDFVSVDAGTSSAIVIRASGRQVS